MANQISLPSPPASSEEEDGDGSAEGDEKKRRKQQEGQIVSGVLVQNDFKLSLMAPEDLKEYAGLTTTTVLCRQRITLAAAGIELIRWSLEGTFGAITEVGIEHKGAMNGVKSEAADQDIKKSQADTVFEIMGGAVRLTHHSGGEIELEWEGNMTNDGIADAVMAVLLSVETSPAAVRKSSAMHNHSYGGFGDEELSGQAVLKQKKNPLANVSAEEKLSRLFMFLEAQFGEDAVSPIAKPKLSQLNGEVNGEANGNSEADPTATEDTLAVEKAEAAELHRLHELGIPVPGVEIRVDKSVAKVWLERLEVECGNKAVGDRVRAVVERAVEVVAPLWH